MEDIKEMMRDMNIRLYRAEDQLAETKTKLITTEYDLATTKQDLNITLTELAETKADLAETKTDLAETKTDLAETKTELMTTKNDLATTKLELNIALDEVVEAQTKKDNELKSEVTRMRNPPYMHACGYQDYTYINSATIPFSTLLYSSTNTEGGGLDIASGVFTSSWPGSYTVTWALQASDDAGDHVVSIYLQHNGENIVESLHQSVYTGPSGVVYDQGIQHYYPYYIVLTLYYRRQNNGTTPGPGGHSTALL